MTDAVAPDGDRLHIAYRWVAGRLEPIKDEMELLFLLDEVRGDPEHVRGFTVDTEEGRAGSILYALGARSGFVVEMVWANGTGILVQFDAEGEAVEFLLTRGMAFAQAAIAAAAAPGTTVFACRGGTDSRAPPSVRE